MEECNFPVNCLENYDGGGGKGAVVFGFREPDLLFTGICKFVPNSADIQYLCLDRYFVRFQ